MFNSENTFIVVSQAAGFALKDRQGDMVQAFQEVAFETEFNEDWTDELDQVLLFTSKEEAEAVCDDLFSDDPAFDWEVVSCFDWQQTTGVDLLSCRIDEELNA